MSNEDEEEEISTSFCPYLHAKNMFSGVFGSGKKEENKEANSSNLSTSSSLGSPDVEKGKCPFGNKSKDLPKTPKGKCPFGYTNTNSTKPKKEDSKKPQEDKETVEDKDIDSDDDAPQGGCPVMNKGKKDPQNKHFEQFYEIPCFGPYDFLFLLRGNLDIEEWLKKTEKIRSYPRYMRNTLFYQAQEKLQKVHEKEFPMVFFIYDDIKQKANRLFRRKKFKECIEHLTYSYGLLKWIQFKDKKRQSEFTVKPSLDAILDDDIEEKHVYLDDVKVEEDSFKACVVFLLEIMAYAHMELRQYTCAIECLNECAEIAEDKVADVYFRRSQARTYNRFSTDEDLKLAMEDIDKAIKIKESEQIYKEHKEILSKIIKERNNKKLENVKKLIEKCRRKLGKIKEFQLSFDQVFFASNEDADKQYRILKEMRDKYNLAVKFFTECKNDEQLKLTYREYEAFHKTYENFKFFYKMNVKDIDPKIRNQLNEEENSFLDSPESSKLIDECKWKLCENVFSDGNFNIELFQYCLDKVFEEDRKAQEEKEKQEEAMRPKVSWSEKILSITKGKFGIYLSIIFVICSFAAIGGHFYIYSNSGPSFGK